MSRLSTHRLAAHAAVRRCRYGNGDFAWNNRVRGLLLTGSAIFVQNSSLYEFWYSDLKPFKSAPLPSAQTIARTCAHAKSARSLQRRGAHRCMHAVRFVTFGSSKPSTGRLVALPRETNRSAMSAPAAGRISFGALCCAALHCTAPAWTALPLHFIPVKADLSDLMQQLQWAKENDSLVRYTNATRSGSPCHRTHRVNTSSIVTRRCGRSPKRASNLRLNGSKWRTSTAREQSNPIQCIESGSASGMEHARSPPQYVNGRAVRKWPCCMGPQRFGRACCARVIAA